MSGEESTTCEACGLTFFYSPKNHRCATPEDDALRASLLAGGGESWADECVRRVMAPRRNG